MFQQLIPMGSDPVLVMGIFFSFLMRTSLSDEGKLIRMGNQKDNSN